MTKQKKIDILQAYKRSCFRLFIIALICLLGALICTLSGFFIESLYTYTSALTSLFFYSENVVGGCILYKWYKTTCVELDTVNDYLERVDDLLETLNEDASDAEEEIWK